MNVVAYLADIPDGGARGFAWPEGPDSGGLFIVRRGAAVYAYANRCPHLGTPLEFLPDRFLTADGREILCSTHGARFEIASGRCVAGPCRGQSLTAVPVMIRDGAILLR